MSFMFDKIKCNMSFCQDIINRIMQTNLYFMVGLTKTSIKKSGSMGSKSTSQSKPCRNAEFFQPSKTVIQL